MKKIYLISVVVFFAATLAKAQDKAPEFGIKFKGFVKTDVIYDSRQTVAAREGHFLLWPAAEMLDVNGKDINAKPNFNMLAIQTRLTGAITGPDAFGAKTSGMIEGAFFGHSNGDVNGFRLRHAFMKLNWSSSELLIGQYWNPMFITGCFPGVVSFNTGAPFQPFARNPQIRFTKSVSDLKIIAAAVSQRDFASQGPAGTGSSYLRNAAVPDMHLQFHYGSDNKEAGTGYLAGVGLEYKTIVPRLSSTDTAGNPVKVDETLSSYAAMAFVTVKTKPAIVRFEGVYGQNLSDLLMLGGWGATSADPVTGEAEYAATNTMSAWIDVESRGEKIVFGLFGGYSANLGADKDIVGSLYGYSNIESMYRIAPRVMFNSGKARFAIEPEYTVAGFAGSYKANGAPQDATEVANLRLLFGAYYFF